MTSQEAAGELGVTSRLIRRARQGETKAIEEVKKRSNDLKKGDDKLNDYLRPQERPKTGRRTAPVSVPLQLPDLDNPLLRTILFNELFG